MKKPQYKDLKFKTAAAFEKWLRLKTMYLIEFNNNHFDPTRWYIDEHGEVLHSNLQGKVWNGKMIVVEKLLNKKPLVKFLDGKELCHTPTHVTVLSFQ